MPTYELGQLKHSWLLLDADILIKAYRYLNEPEMGSFLNTLKNLEVKTIITRQVSFEITAGCASAKELESYTSFLEDVVTEPLLPEDNDIYNTATNIAAIYRNKKQKDCGAGLTDCLLSSFLKKFHHVKLNLLTSNLKDFPLLLHERRGIHTIDVGSQVIMAGVISFDSKKYQKCLDDLHNS